MVNFLESAMQNPYVAGFVMILIVIVVLYYIFGKGKKTADQIKKMWLEQTAYDWGKKQLKEHTLEDLEEDSKVFLRINKSLIREDFGSKIKIGKAKKIQRALMPEDEKLKLDSEDKFYIVQFKVPLIDFLDFFPFDIIVTDLLGSKKWLFLAKSNINYQTNKVIMLKTKQMTQLYGIYVPIDNIKEATVTLNELVFKAGYAEILGRLNNIPADIAKLHLEHTEDIDRAKEEAKIFAERAKAMNPPLRSI